RGGLSDSHLYLAAELQEVRRPQNRGYAQGGHKIWTEHRASLQHPTGLYTAAVQCGLGGDQGARPDLVMAPEAPAAARDILSKGVANGPFLTLASKDISRPPTTRERIGDRAFRQCTHGFAWLTVLLVVYVVIRIGRVALPAINTYGASFLVGTTWDANRGRFGILPAIAGTLYSSVLGLII